jgi:hypothetical protein
MKNAKTTIFGLLSAIGGYFAMNSTGKLQIVGQAVAGISTFFLGAAAKDADNNEKK